jgi:peptide/nickel transport system permease protein
VALEAVSTRPFVAHRAPSRRAKMMRTVRKKYVGSGALLIIGVFITMAVFGPWLTPYDALEVQPVVRLQAPSLSHLLGTDELGRDVFSRLIIGSRVSLAVALGATLLSTVFGILIGLTSAYFQGRYDLIMQRFVDALLSIPSLILAMVLVATLGASITNVMIAIAVTAIGAKARLVRGAALGVKQNQYVEAAQGSGATSFRIMLRHILPNIWAPIIVFFSVSLGTAIIRESSLSFLGLGPPPPNPTWGSMLSGNARNYMATAPWLAIAPGLCITLVVLSFNLVGDALRDILDPRLRNS